MKAAIRISVVVALSTAVFVWPGPASGADVEFTACGGAVPPHQTGALRKDVVCVYRCSNDPSRVCDGYEDELNCPDHCLPERFTLGDGAKLELRGHSIKFAYESSAVGCEGGAGGTCSVVGPGSIVGGKGAGVSGGAADVLVENLSIVFTNAAVYTDGRLLAKRLKIGFERENQLRAGKGIWLEYSRIASEAGAQSGGDMLVEHTQLGPDGEYFVPGSFRGHHLKLAGGLSVFAKHIRLRQVVTTPDLRRALGGALLSAAGDLRLTLAHVFSIESGRPPHLDRSVCRESRRFGSQATWGVCTND